MQTSQKYKEDIKEDILDEMKDLSDEQIANLIKIIHVFKDSIISQREYDFELKKEIEEWDSLSDEALLNFEDTL